MAKREDFYYREAKRLGYRARSAFKLIQIQRKFNIIREGDLVLDLGAAPGSWCQVIRKIVGKSGRVIGIDISPFTPINDVVFIRGDITSEETKERLREILSGEKLNVVLSDLSPKTSGVHSLDHARSIWLGEHALKYAEEFLSKKGNFVCKLFEGEESLRFRKKLEKIFSTVRYFSPKASRKESSEKYIVAKGFKG